MLQRAKSALPAASSPCTGQSRTSLPDCQLLCRPCHCSLAHTRPWWCRKRSRAPDSWWRHRRPPAGSRHLKGWDAFSLSVHRTCRFFNCRPASYCNTAIPAPHSSTCPAFAITAVSSPLVAGGATCAGGQLLARVASQVALAAGPLAVTPCPRVAGHLHHPRGL